MSRRAAVALAALGLVLLFVGLVLLKPENFESARDGLRAGEEAPLRGLVARGPAVGVYDASRDVTHVVFGCSHWWCDYAVTVSGNVTHRLDAASFLLVPVGGDRGLVPIEQDIALGEPFAPVGNATATTFVMRSPHLRAALAPGGVLLLALAVALCFNAPRDRATLAGAACAGTLVGYFVVAPGGMMAILFAVFVSSPAILIGAVLMAVPRLAPYGRALVLWALVAFAAALASDPYFPTAPEL